MEEAPFLQVLQRKTEEAAVATKRLKELLEARKSSARDNSGIYTFSLQKFPFSHILIFLITCLSISVYSNGHALTGLVNSLDPVFPYTSLFYYRAGKKLSKSQLDFKQVGFG